MMMTDDEYRQVVHIRAECAADMMEVVLSLMACLTDALIIERSMHQRINAALLVEEGKQRPPRLPVETLELEGNLAGQVGLLTKKMDAQGEVVKEEEKEEWAARRRLGG